MKKKYLVLACVALVVWGQIFWPVSKDLKIDFLSLGQGDCIFVRFPGGGNLLIDGGRRQQPGDRPVQLVQYLRNEGVKRIDAMVNTHPQSDHIGNLPEVLETFEVGAVFHCGKPGEGEFYELFDQLAKEEGCDYRPLHRGQGIYGFDSTQVTVLGPQKNLIHSDEQDLNVYSMILHLQYGEFSCLLTGDISTEEEEALVDSGLVSDVWILKVSHHGSKYSSSSKFLQEIRPEVAVIQVGGNSYGHPTKEAMDRLRDCGALVLRTDRQGTIRVRSDGKGYSVQPLLGSQRYQRSKI